MSHKTTSIVAVTCIHAICGKAEAETREASLNICELESAIDELWSHQYVNGTCKVRDLVKEG
jgi:hypothetical protein